MAASIFHHLNGRLVLQCAGWPHAVPQMLRGAELGLQLVELDLWLRRSSVVVYSPPATLRTVSLYRGTATAEAGVRSTASGRTHDRTYPAPGELRLAPSHPLWAVIHNTEGLLLRPAVFSVARQLFREHVQLLLVEALLMQLDHLRVLYMTDVRHPRH